MSTLAQAGGHDHGDDEVARGLVELQRHLAQVAPTDAGARDAAATSTAGGVSRRVRARLREHDEAARLLALDADDTPFLVEDESVRARRKAVRRAGQLYVLDNDPAALAYRDARVRRLVVTTGMVSLVLALLWSTSGVQHFAADGAPTWSAQWWGAWLVEPFLSLALLTIVGARAYLAVRGRPLDHPGIERTEWVFLAATLFMNVWPYLPWTVQGPWRVAPMVVHLLGPIVAVAVVRALPRLLARFGDLRHDHLLPEGTSPSCSENTPTGGDENTTARRPGAPGTAPAHLLARAQELIATGALRPDAGAKPIRRALRCSMETAQRVRDDLHRISEEGR